MDANYYAVIWTIVGIMVFLFIVLILTVIWVFILWKREKRSREHRNAATFFEKKDGIDLVSYGQHLYPVASIGHDAGSGDEIGEITVQGGFRIRIRYRYEPSILDQLRRYKAQ